MYLNYDNSIVSIPNSILKYFNQRPKHATNKVIDKILETKKYENIVVILFDGLGVANLAFLKDNSFIKQKLVTTLSSTFPPTTTASTTSIQTGLYPAEHLYLGWNMYFADLDDAIDLYPNKSKKGKTYDYNIAYHKFKPKTIVEELKEKITAKTISPFGDITYTSLAELKEILEQETSKEGPKYFYCYYTNPDSLMHKNGVDSEIVKEEINKINDFLANLKLPNSLVIVTADHGHINVKNNYLGDYPELARILRTPLTIEDRSVGLNIKKGQDNKLKEIYQKYFKDKFILLSKEEVISKQLFGPTASSDFKEYLSDYLMIATADESLVDDIEKLSFMKGAHAGMTDEEGLIPLIIFEG